MNDQEFIAAVRNAQQRGDKWIRGRLREAYRGVKNIAIDISGQANHNRHDLWIMSERGGKIIGRAYLGSRRLTQQLEGWPARILHFC